MKRLAVLALVAGCGTNLTALEQAREFCGVGPGSDGLIPLSWQVSRRIAGICAEEAQ